MKREKNEEKRMFEWCIEIESKEINKVGNEEERERWIREKD